MDEKKPPADILEEIMSRSEKPLPSPVSYPPKFDPPPEDTPQPPPAAKKSPLADRLLPWLCALLGGAVLAALVLGFQLFSVNARLDGLQANLEGIQTMDELMDENEKLRTVLQAMGTTQQEELARQEELEQQVQTFSNQYLIVDHSLGRAAALSWLERFCAQREWLMAACVVEDCDAMFNPRNRAYGPIAPLPAALSARYLQLREDVMEQSKLLAVTRTDINPEDPDHYFERVDIYPASTGPHDQKAVDAAMEFWHVLSLYGQGDPNGAAILLTNFYHPELLYWKELEGGAFQPDTVELFRQVKDDLIQSGLIRETKAGTVTTTERIVHGILESGQELLD